MRITLLSRRRTVLVCANTSAAPSAITSDSQTIAKSLRAESRTARLLLQSSVLGHADRHGDGGKLCGLLACHMVACATKAAASPAALQAWMQCFRTCSQWCEAMLSVDGPPRWPQPRLLQALSSPLLPVTCQPLLPRADVLLAKLRHAVCPRLQGQVSGKDVDRVCLLVLQAFTQGLPATATAAGSVHVAPVVGLPCAASELLPGVLVAALPERTGPLPRTPARIVLFSVGLGDAPGEQSGYGAGGVAAQLGPGEQADARAAGLEALRALLRQLAAAGVRIVASQRVIHPELAQLCGELGMLPWHRLSLRHIGPVSQVAGCCPVGVAQTLPNASDWDAHMGTVDGIAVVELGPRKFVHLRAVEGTAGAAVQSLVVGAEESFAAEEWKAVVASCLKVLRRSLTTPGVCFGGGYTEMALAHNLRKLLQASARPDAASKLALTAFASGLEAYALALAPEDTRLEISDAWQQTLEDLAGHLSRCLEPPGRDGLRCGCDLPGWLSQDVAGDGVWVGTLAPIAHVACQRSSCADDASGSATEGGQPKATAWQVSDVVDVRLAQLADTTAAAIALAVEMANVVLSVDGVMGERPQLRPTATPHL